MKKQKEKKQPLQEKEEEILEEVLEEEQEEVSEANQLEEELKLLNDRYLRLQAEYSNYRRRTAEEKASIYKFANERIMMELLPLLDNFERALSIMKDDEGAKPYLEGVELIQKAFIEVLEKEGLCEIEACGQEFDPSLHHAVLTEECEDKIPGIVLDELQKGYTLNEKVIRPTMVKVSK